MTCVKSTNTHVYSTCLQTVYENKKVLVLVMTEKVLDVITCLQICNWKLNIPKICALKKYLVKNLNILKAFLKIKNKITIKQDIIKLIIALT